MNIKYTGNVSGMWYVTINAISASVLLLSLPLFFHLKWRLQQGKAIKFCKLEILIIINEGLFNNDVNVNEIAEKIEDHILRQIYKDVFPKTHQADNSFYNRTKCLEWVTPEQLEIKNAYEDCNS